MPQAIRVIRTVTMNPALDEAVVLAHMVLGSTNRCTLDAMDPGGKGVNASRVIQRLGRATLALGFTGRVTGEFLRAQLDREHVPHAFEESGGLTRVNLMVYESDSGRRTRIYLPGTPLGAGLLDDLKLRLEQVEPGAVVVLGGSLPPGIPVSAYADLVTWLRLRGVRSIVDTSGPALAHVLAAKPLAVKPNVEEAQEVLGRHLHGRAAILEAAHELCARGAQYAVISQGADGAIGAGPQGAWQAVPPDVDARSSVGSGDSMVAGLAIAFNEGSTFAEGLRLGTAAGAATAMTPGTQLCQAGEVELLLPRVVLNELTAQACTKAG